MVGVWLCPNCGRVEIPPGGIHKCPPQDEADAQRRVAIKRADAALRDYKAKGLT